MFCFSILVKSGEPIPDQSSEISGGDVGDVTTTPNCKCILNIIYKVY